MKRRLMKLGVIFLMAPRLLLAALRYRVLVVVLGDDDALLDISDLMRSWRGTPGVVARRVLLQYILGSDAIASSATIHACLFSKQGVRVGGRVYIGFDCNLGRVTVGDGTLLSDGVIVMSGAHQHTRSASGEWTEGESPRVTIGRNVWIGAGAIIMADVGDDAVVGAGSVVTKPVAAREKVGGVPARRIGVG